MGYVRHCQSHIQVCRETDARTVASQSYLQSSLCQLEESILADHRHAVSAYKANRRPDLHSARQHDQQVRCVCVLLRLLTYVGRVRESGLVAGRETVKQVTLKCRDAVKSCCSPEDALWSDDIQRLLYPVAVRAPYRFVAQL